MFYLILIAIIVITLFGSIALTKKFKDVCFPETFIPIVFVCCIIYIAITLGVLKFNAPLVERTESVDIVSVNQIVCDTDFYYVMIESGGAYHLEDIPVYKTMIYESADRQELVTTWEEYDEETNRFWFWKPTFTCDNGRQNVVYILYVPEGTVIEYFNVN